MTSTQSKILIGMFEYISTQFRGVLGLKPNW